MNITIHYSVTLSFQLLEHMQQGLMTEAGPEASGEKTLFEEGKVSFNVLAPHQIDGVAVDHGSTSWCIFLLMMVFDYLKMTGNTQRTSAVQR
jgi:hypothetical protein